MLFYTPINLNLTSLNFLPSSLEAYYPITVFLFFFLGSKAEQAIATFLDLWRLTNPSQFFCFFFPRFFSFFGYPKGTTFHSFFLLFIRFFTFS